MSTVLFLIWGMVVLAGLVGFGGAALRFCRYKHVPWAIAGSIGFVVFTFLTGLLNLAGAVHIWTMAGLVAVGFALFLCSTLSAGGRESARALVSPEWRDAVTWLLLICVVLLVAVPALHSIRDRRLDYADDLSAYLTFPAKTLQIGSLPYEPFSERRVTSSLGAAYVVQCLMLVAGDVDSVAFLDRGLGMILFAGAIFALARTFGQSVRISLGVVVLVCLLPIDHTNLTMTTLPAALFAAMFWLEGVEGTVWGRAALLGALAAGVSVLKSSYLPAAGLFCLLYFGFRWLHARRAGIVGELAVCMAGGVVTALPWMLDMKRKEGTLLYPILGRGFEISAYGPVPHAAHAGAYPWLVAAPQFSLFLLAAALIWLACRKSRLAMWLEVSSILAVCGMGILLISVSVGGASVTRYTTAFQLTGLAVTVLFLTRAWRQTGVARSPLLAAMACTAVLVGALGFHDLAHEGYREYQQPWTAGPFPLDIPSERLRAARLQAAIPPGEQVFSYLLYSYAFNFKRNPIYLADFPGMASLPPGMPIQGSPEDLRQYLLGHSIRYMAYSTVRITSDRALMPAVPRRGETWPRMQGLVSADVTERMLALGTQFRSVYDDRDERVIDLQSPIR